MNIYSLRCGLIDPCKRCIAHTRQFTTHHWHCCCILHRFHVHWWVKWTQNFEFFNFYDRVALLHVKFSNFFCIRNFVRIFFTIFIFHSMEFQDCLIIGHSANSNRMLDNVACILSRELCINFRWIHLHCINKLWHD